MIEYPRVPFPQHLSHMRNWRQGEHLLMSAPTSAGKTTFIKPILEQRSHVVALFTKLADPTIRNQFAGYKRFEKWPKHGLTRQETRVMIWPKPEKTLAATIAKHREIMAHALDRITADGNRAVLIDEGLYLTDPKFGNLAREVGMLHYTGRSLGITMVTLMQRPFYIPKVVLSSVTHAYVARTYDAGDQKRLSDFGAVDAKEIIHNMHSLSDRHDFIYLNPQGDAPAAIVNSRK